LRFLRLAGRAGLVGWVAFSTLFVSVAASGYEAHWYHEIDKRSASTSPIIIMHLTPTMTPAKTPAH